LSFNLINDKWIPVRRRDGAEEKIAPCQIADKHSRNPIIEIKAPRPDFTGALIQFLIGLIQTTFQPKDDDEWRKRFSSPPKTDELEKAFSKVADAFNLDSGKHRFMQDAEIDGDALSVNALLINSPGDNTVKKNADFFVKSQAVEGFCNSCIATALFAMQTNAPSGGQGHRTSLRGGGPLTTLVLGENLWEAVWLNVLNKKDFSNLVDGSKKSKPEDTFPWLAPTRTSEGGKNTTPVDLNPAQMFWATPRRILLNFKDTESGTCAICGDKSDRLVKSYSTKNFGVNYEGGFKHPLSPHYTDNRGTLLPRHAKQGGVTYRHWLGLILDDEVKKYESATVIKKFIDDGRESSGNGVEKVFWAFGYEMDNMKAVCWHESRMPLLYIEENIREEFTHETASLVNAADEVSGNLISCLKEAWFPRKQDAKGDFSFAGIAFWHKTETAFYATLQKLKTELEKKEDTEETRRGWHKTIYRESIRIFDLYANSGDIADGDMGRIAKARNNLGRFNNKKKIVIDLLRLPKKEGVANDG
jgi:CRISPR system Cascade subunit CasA